MARMGQKGLDRAVVARRIRKIRAAAKSVL